MFSNTDIYLAIRDDKNDKLSNYANNDFRETFIRAQTKQDVLDPERATPELAQRIRDARDLFDARRSAIYAVLNRYETFAIGIDERALDEQMYRRWWRTSLIRDWYSLKGTIDAIRGTGPRSYVEFQSLAQKWESETVKEDGNVPRFKKRW